MSDQSKGVFRKYNVSRTDGRDQPGEKHENCRYFVLDLDHDPHAVPALQAYAESCKKEREELSKDLFAWVKWVQGREWGHVPQPDWLGDLYE